MVNFFKGYDKFSELDFDGKKELVASCVKFYDDKTVEYILENLPNSKKKKFKKEPVEVIFVDKSPKDVYFGDNVVTVLDTFLMEGKKEVFFKVAQNTICAVFVHLFYNTASDPKKKTKFGTLANNYLASITNEFSANKDFTADMMQEYAQMLGEVMDLGMSE